MGRGIAFLCLAFGVAMCAAALDLLPSDYVILEAPSGVVGSMGAVFVVVGLATLARDHSGSDVLAAILLLAFSAITGWLTFYGPEGLIDDGISFIPTSVSQSLGRLLFGFGVVASVGMAILALRKLFS